MRILFKTQINLSLVAYGSMATWIALYFKGPKFKSRGRQFESRLEILLSKVGGKVGNLYR